MTTSQAEPPVGGTEPPVTGNEAVDAALAAVGDLGTLEPAEQLARLDAAQRALAAALTDSQVPDR